MDYSLEWSVGNWKTDEMVVSLDDNLRDFITKIPKVELHIHLEGCVTPEFWYQLNLKNKHRQSQPLSSLETLQKKFCFNNFLDFIVAFRDVVNSFYTPEDLYDLAYFAIDKARLQNIRYIEFFFSPWFFVRRKIDFHEMMEEINRACKEGEKKWGITTKFLFDGPRNFGTQGVMDTFKLATQDTTGRVIGVGLGGDEINYPARDFIDEFKFARAHGLRTVAHAGEGGGEQSMLDAMELLCVERLGHCLGIAESSKLEDLILEQQILLELCPTSNLSTGTIKNIEAHPFMNYLNRNYAVSLHSDDPGFFQTSLVQEYRLMTQLHNLNTAQLSQLTRNSIEGSFMSSSEKNILCSEINELEKQYNFSPSRKEE